MGRVARIQVLLCAFIAWPLAFADPAVAAEWHVAPGGTGNGSAAAPFGSVQDALRLAKAGDSITVAAGTFHERLSTVAAGTDSRPIRIRSAKQRPAVITSRGRVLTVNHPYLVVENLVLDGQFGDDDIVRVAGGATGFTLRNSEVRRTSKDAIDMGAVSDVLIDGALIHHALNAANGRTDAHGIAAGAVRRLTIRNTEIHTFSGDAVQVDPDRAAPGWNDVLIESCRFWLEPLSAPVNGFEAGTVPGENALDTKANLSLQRARLTIRDTEAHGFRSGLIGNMAAFNLKENIDATLDGVTVFDSEIAFRLRAPAQVRVQNAVVYSVLTGVRYEENITGVRLWNVTFGRAVETAFRAAASSASVLDVRNVLLLGSSLPKEASSASNLAVSSPAFVNAAAHNYRLASGSAAIDAGFTIAEVATDRQGTRRPQGTAFDIGAYERILRKAHPGPQSFNAPSGTTLFWRTLDGAGRSTLPRSKSHQKTGEPEQVGEYRDCTLQPDDSAG